MAPLQHKNYERRNDLIAKASPYIHVHESNLKNSKRNLRYNASLPSLIEIQIKDLHSRVSRVACISLLGSLLCFPICKGWVGVLMSLSFAVLFIGVEAEFGEVRR